MRRTPSVLIRGGAGAAAVLAATLLSVPGTAHAADDPAPDLAVTATDLNTPATRVGDGDNRRLHAEIRNAGTAPATGFTYTIGLDTGADLAGPVPGCVYDDPFPDDEGAPWAYGASHATCTVTATLQPGEALPVAFDVTFGRNLSGPERHEGYLYVEQAENETNNDNNYADVDFWSKRNRHDVAVLAPAVRGKPGQTVDLKFRVVNHGPADGGGPGVLVQAPRGTVLLPSDWCWTDGTEYQKLPESTRVRCNFESFFPTVHSGFGTIRHTVPLKIKSSPGRDGFVRGDGEMTPGTETRWANNTAQIVVRAR